MINLKTITNSAFTALILVASIGAFSAQAALPNNCAQDTAKLAELVKSAHFLPANMDKDIVGHWRGKRLGASVDIKMEKTRSGRLMMDLHVVSNFLGIDMQDKAPVALCFSNEDVIDVHVKVFNKNEHVRLQVVNRTTFKLLNGKLKATYKKQ